MDCHSIFAHFLSPSPACCSKFFALTRTLAPPAPATAVAPAAAQGRLLFHSTLLRLLHRLTVCLPPQVDPSMSGSVAKSTGRYSPFLIIFLVCRRLSKSWMLRL